MWDKTPTRFFISCGAGEGSTPLTAFDAALIQADIGRYNLVKVTSVVPPGAMESKTIEVPSGTPIPTAFANIHSVQPDEIISAAVSVAIPADKNNHGLIMEYTARGNKQTTEEIVRKMAEEGMEMRGFKIDNIKSLAVEHRVIRIGSVIAAVLLW